MNKKKLVGPALAEQQLKHLLQNYSQTAPPKYKQPPLSKRNYQKLQQTLLSKLPNSSTSAITSNYAMHSNSDSEHPYYQNSHLLYLTGISESGCSLLLHKNKYGEGTIILFAQVTHKEKIVWEGKKLSNAQLTEISGINNIYPASDFFNVLSNYALQSQTLGFALNESPYAHHYEDAQLALQKKVMQRFPQHTTLRLTPLLAQMRSQKNAEEVSAVKNAITITHAALQAVASKMADAHKNKQILAEYELEATIINIFTKFASQHAFMPIVASGKNACTLHYIDNNKPIAPPDSVLIDCGAKFFCYNADITRVLPSALTFTDRQREVYAATLAVLQFAKSILTPGLKVKTYISETTSCMEENLKKLKLLGKHNKKTMNNYFMHGISHQLGIDVHDLSSGEAIFLPGMLLTVEPGIYISEEGIGMRLEDNVLIGGAYEGDAYENNSNEGNAKSSTQSSAQLGNICLSSDIPLEIEDVEAMMCG